MLNVLVGAAIVGGWLTCGFLMAIVLRRLPRPSIFNDTDYAISLGVAVLFGPLAIAMVAFLVLTIVLGTLVQNVIPAKK